MSIKDIRRVFERLADRGEIEENRVLPLTLQMVGESAVQAFHMAYFGELLDTQIASVRNMEHTATEVAMNRLEAVVNDLASIRRAHQETLTTSDFPLSLALARQSASRPGYTYPESDLLNFAVRRTADNFKPLRSTRPGTLNHRVLPVRPELTNLQYARFYSTQDGYTVANYELGLEYTNEMYRNDDIGEFTSAAAELGVAARATRAWVLLDAVFTRADRLNLPTPANGLDSANIDAIADFLAVRTIDDKRVARLLTDLFVPTNQKRKAERSMDNEWTAPMVKNPVYNLATVHVEDLITEFATEYGLGVNTRIAMDGRSKPLEFATLRGYEGGPKTFTRLVDVKEEDIEGNFENHLLAVKVSDNCGGTVRDPAAVVIVEDD